MGDAGMIGYRNSYHYGGGQHIIYECEARCPAGKPGMSCWFVKHSYHLARIACKLRGQSTFRVDTGARALVKPGIDRADMIHDVVVAAMINRGKFDSQCPSPPFG